MSTGTLAPDVRYTVLDSSGKPISGARLLTYIAGTTTPQATYTDVGLLTPNANPIIADGAGRIGPIFLPPGQSFKFVFQNPDSSGLFSQDNVSAVPGSSAGVDIIGVAGETLAPGQAVYLSDGSGGKTAGSWYRADSANAYSSTLNEVAMVPAAIASGASGTMRLEGYITGLSSLTVGTLYYVGTAGALTSSAPANRRLVGEADTTSSLVVSANPPIQGLTVAQGGTGATTLTAHGVLIGEGTGAIVATAVGAAGTVLTGVASADPTFQVPTWSLLKANSGTDATAGATTVDSIATGALTAKDRLKIFVTVEEITAQVARIDLYSVTDSTIVTRLSTGGTVGAGVTLCVDVTISQGQTGATKYVSVCNGATTGGVVTETANITMTTAWTTGFTLGLRHGGVTATGSFDYSWAVYLVKGE